MSMGRLRKALSLAALLFAWNLASTPAQAGSTLVMSEYSKFCLDVDGGRSDNGTAIIMYWCHGGQNQKMEFLPSGQIRVLGKCLDASGGWGRNGDKIILFDCHNGANQKWRIVDGKRIVGINNKCMQIWGNGWWPWVGLELGDCANYAPQLWLGARLLSAREMGISPQAADQAFQASWTSRRAPVIGNDAGSMVSAGNSNIVAAGGGNIVAAGGGNLVAAGGGN